MNALTIGAMIAHLLAVQIGRIFAAEIGIERLSFEKLFDVLARHHTTAKCLEDILNFEVDIRYISRDKRSREIPLAKGLAALA